MTPLENPTIPLVIRKVPRSRKSTTSGTWRWRAASRLPKLSIRSLVACTNIPAGTGLGFASAARANVHATVLYGRSSHHHVEAVFKAFARALRVACATDARLAKMLPSTKGLL